MKKKNISYTFVLILFLLISIGYAALNSTLNINGKSSVSKNTWDVHFDNVVVTDGSVSPIKEPVVENETTVNFEVALNLPGDFYEFTVDVVNGGTIDAMIDSITKSPDLTLEQQKYLNYIIEYQNGEQIASKQLVKTGKYLRVKVLVELKKDIDSSDLPQEELTLDLSFILNCVQANDSSIEVKDNGIFKVKPVADGDINDIGTIVTIGSEKFYTIGTDGDNVKLLSMYNLFVGTECTTASSASCIPYESTTGMQDESMLGMILNSDNYLRKGITSFSTLTQKGTNYSDYNGSLVELYVNDYKFLLENKFGVDVVDARLITKEELTDENTFACSETNNTCSNSPYEWIYGTSYWTSSNSGKDYIWAVTSFKRFGDYQYNYDYFGVRPVIVISKNEFADRNSNIINFKIDGVTYQAEEGMTWEEWVNSEYNVLGVYFDYSDPSLTMIYYLNNDISLGGVLVGAESHEYAHTTGCLCAPEITQVIDPNWDGYWWSYNDIW